MTRVSEFNARNPGASPDPFMCELCEHHVDECVCYDNVDEQDRVDGPSLSADERARVECLVVEYENLMHHGLSTVRRFWISSNSDANLIILAMKLALAR